MILINKPYITKENEKYVRLCCNITIEGKDNLIWYEVEKEYSCFLCFERADAFLVAILPYAMAFGNNVVVEGAISEKLYWQLTQVFISMHKVKTTDFSP